MQAKSTPVESITVRAAEPGDRLALAALAQLDSTVPLFDAVLVAEQDGRIVAAITADGSALADPFRHTHGIIEFMRSETAAHIFGTLAPLGRSRALDAGYEPRARRSRRYWRTKPATNAGL
ncbi:MAG TPA: hypothetical protein VFB51_07125 [Solirubrobacterales bacterium]|nr:hypothetical protein [Solirubrobacterales bacterium]